MQKKLPLIRWVAAGCLVAGLCAGVVAGGAENPAAAKGVRLPFIVYDEQGGPNNHYVPTGWMGNTKAVKMDDGCTNRPHGGKTCLRFEYDEAGDWAGIVWQDPASDWGDQAGGWNLTGAGKLTFWARGEQGGEIVTFKFGILGPDKKYSDRASGDTGAITLTKGWTKYSIDLDGKDLTRVKTGFVWTLAGQGAPVVFYLDDIQFERGETEAVGPAPDAKHGGWQLVWSDEFKQPDGSLPDPGKWGCETGGNGWGNDELECYTARTNNVRIENGKLVIEACEESFGGRNITSARLLTRGRASWTYGRVEARIKIPRGQGVWPAFWMLGSGIGSADWPACGEVDIMENIGKEPGLIHGTLHGPGYSGTNGIGGPASLPGGALFADDFHVYAVECETNLIRWFVDDQPYVTVTPDRLPPGTHWVFNQPKFVLLNLAVGGGWPGNPDGTTTYPLRMTVDYVRVYKKTGEIPAVEPDQRRN